jgi:SAM-dependent methyltransferase
VTNVEDKYGPIDLPGETEEFRPYLDPIYRMLEFCRSESDGVLLDFGSGPGVWSLVGSKLYDQVISVDLNDRMLERAQDLFTRNGANNVEHIDLRQTPADELGEIGAAVTVGVIELAGSRHVVDMFQTVASKLKPGGVFLCMTRRPFAVLSTLFTLNRLRVDGPIKGTKRTLAVLRSALEANLSPAIRPIERARFYHSSRAIEALAADNGLILLKSPRELGPRPEFIGFEPYCAPRLFGRPTIRWHLFQKPKSGVL